VCRRSGDRRSDGDKSIPVSSADHSFSALASCHGDERHAAHFIGAWSCGNQTTTFPTPVGQSASPPHLGGLRDQRRRGVFAVRSNGFSRLRGVPALTSAKNPVFSPQPIASCGPGGSPILARLFEPSVPSLLPVGHYRQLSVTTDHCRSLPETIVGHYRPLSVTTGAGGTKFTTGPRGCLIAPAWA